MTTPRNYQIDVFLRARQQNTITCLPTGSGKTKIAALLAIEYLRDLNSKGKKVIFLADKVVLVLQQSSVLEQEFKIFGSWNVGTYAGEKAGVDGWFAEEWKKELAKVDVLVMTPAILVRMLSRNYINIAMTSLLLFDECHHCTKNHPYSQILTYYRRVPLEDRPRVFGMTASPVKIRTQPDYSSLLKEIFKLEQNMESTVYIPDPELVRTIVSPPDETIKTFEHGPVDEPTSGRMRTFMHRVNLLISAAQQVAGSDANAARALKKLSKKLDGSEEVYYQLGLWGQMLYLDHMLEKHSHDAIGVVRDLCCGVLIAYNESGLRDMVGSTSWISHKVHALVETLTEYCQSQPSRDAFRSIVFVQTRAVASSLAKLLRHIPLLQDNGIEPVLLLGSRNAAVGMDNGKVTSAKIQDLVGRFRSGAANVLVATSVAEEGLDVAYCSLVVLFSSAEITLAKYLQTRGRARRTDSSFVIFVAQDDSKTLDLLHKARIGEDNLKLIMQTFRCQEHMDASAVSARVLAALEPSLPDQDVFTIPSTQERLELNEAVPRLSEILQRFAAVSGDISFRPSFRTDGPVPPFISTVTLPSWFQIPPIASEPRPDPTSAKNKAALLACIALHEKGFVDDHLKPLVKHKLLPSLEQKRKREEKNIPPTHKRRELESKQHADTEEGSGFKKYKRVAPPVLTEQFKTDSDGNVVAYLYFILITAVDSALSSLSSSSIDTPMTNPNQSPLVSPVNSPVNSSGGASPLSNPPSDMELDSESTWPPFGNNAFGILSASGTLSVHPFRIYPPHLQGRSFEVSLSPPKQRSIPIDAFDHFKSLHQLFFASFLDMPFIPLHDSLGTLQTAHRNYLVVPFHHDPGHDNMSVQWEMETALKKFEEVKQQLAVHNGDALDHIRQQQSNSLTGAVVFTNYDPARKYEVLRVRNDLNPRNELDFEVARDSIVTGNKIRTFAELFEDRIIRSMMPKSTPSGPFNCSIDFTQPLLEVRAFSTSPVNVFAKNPSSRNKNAGSMFLLPQFCTIMPLSAPLYALSKWLPSIFAKMERYMMFEHLRTQLGFPVRQDLWYTALTAQSTMDVDGNYERLELMGDSVLKYLSTVQVFSKYSHADEGLLNEKRVEILNNNNLYRAAKNLSLFEFIENKRFDPKCWVPPLLAAAGQETDSTLIRVLKPQNRDPASAWSSTVSADQEFIQVKDKQLADVVEALTGALYLSNEDGITAAVTFLSRIGILDENFHEWLYNVSAVPQPSPPSLLLSRASTSMVNEVQKLQGVLNYQFNNETLLLEALTHGSAAGGNPSYQRLEFLGDAILDIFVCAFLYDSLPDAEAGLLTQLRASMVNSDLLGLICVQNGIHECLIQHSGPLQHAIDIFVTQTNSFMLDPQNSPFNVDAAPKVLCDMFEAIIGALYLDSDLPTVWSVMCPLLEPFLSRCIKEAEIVALGPVPALNEFLAKRGMQDEVEFKSSVVNNQSVMQIFVGDIKIGEGSGHNKKIAHKRAASVALRTLQSPASLVL
eukprot:GILJ01010952.1.p1 GENE.GILJ01010952.1~~GILJ01010952.1.p1  ORF type:complete len:1506 (+),score=221.30 GILJ01010952.1:95-4612(+)